jgi:hypothetical protein
MRQQGGEVMDRDVALVHGGVIVTILVLGLAPLWWMPLGGREENSPPTASATATPPRNGSIRTWAADGHWWVVGDGWGQHHPGCPCHAKAEVE